MSDWALLRRTIIVIGTVAFALALWQILNILLLAFAAVLISIIFRAAARPLSRHTPIPDGLAVGLTVFVFFAVLGGMGILFGAAISDQLSSLYSAMPGSFEELGRLLGVENISERIGSHLQSQAGNVAKGLTSFAQVAVTGATNLIVVIVAAIFIALKPDSYRDGVLLLFPAQQRPRIEETLDHTASALELWFLGQLISMAIVGVLMSVAFWLIGLPSAIGLGLIAGVAEFVPLLGPFIGAIPPLVLAIGAGTETALWTLAAVLAVQQLESNVITPIVQRQTVSLPPALTLFTLLAFGGVSGLLGLLFAVPITVAAYVAVKELYLRHALGEDVSIPGENEDKSNKNIEA
jgi:predicted PurR-regulated permease PerM